MRSVRLGDELELRLQEISQETGQPVSEIIREAVKKRCDQILGGKNERRLSYFIGALKSTKAARRATPADDTGRAFGRLLSAQMAAQSRRAKKKAKR